MKKQLTVEKFSPLSLSLHKPTAGACPEPDDIIM